jgi:hypothetical protein
MAYISVATGDIEFARQTFGQGVSCVCLLVRLLAFLESHVSNQAWFYLQTESAIISESYT